MDGVWVIFVAYCVEALRSLGAASLASKRVFKSISLNPNTARESTGDEGDTSELS